MARNMRRFYELFAVSAERMEYYYVLREEMPEPLNGVIGLILNDTDEELQIALEVDNEYMEQHKAYDPLLYVDPEDYKKGCMIILNSRLAKRLIGGDLSVIFGLWHEVGIYHNMSEHVEEYMNSLTKETGGYTAEEYLAIVSDEVMPMDAAADDFAEAYCGRDESIIALNGLIADCKKNPATMNDRGRIHYLLNRKNRIAGR